MGRLSIILSVLNGVRYLDDLIKNIESIRYRDYEVVCVVDSRSTDDSVREYRDSFSVHEGWTVIIQDDDEGLGGARNLGLEAASGDYIWFIDIDDRFDPDMPSVMIENMERYEADIARCNYLRIRKSEYKGGLPEIPEKDYTIRIMDRDEALHERFEERLSLTTWSMVFRRRFIDEGLRFIPDNIAEDDHFTVLTLSRVKKVVYLERPLYFYIYDDGSEWRVRPVAKEKKRVYDLLIKDFEERNDPMIGELRSFSIRLALHEALRMEKKGFLEFTRTPEFLDEYNHYCSKDRREMFVFNHFPTIYYHIARRIIMSRGDSRSFS